MRGARKTRLVSSGDPFGNVELTVIPGVIPQVVKVRIGLERISSPLLDPVKTGVFRHLGYGAHIEGTIPFGAVSPFVDQSFRRVHVQIRSGIPPHTGCDFRQFVHSFPLFGRRFRIRFL